MFVPTKTVAPSLAAACESRRIVDGIETDILANVAINNLFKRLFDKTRWCFDGLTI